MPEQAKPLIPGDKAGFEALMRRHNTRLFRVARSILNQPGLAPYNDGEISPGKSVETDEEILAWVRRDAETALHPSCTAKLGTESDAVVDPTTMAVHGLEGIRVADASVFPFVTNGNIYAPVMMVAEKSADIILGNTPLAAEPVEFYRHRATVAESNATEGRAQ